MFIVEKKTKLSNPWAGSPKRYRNRLLHRETGQLLAKEYISPLGCPKMMSLIIHVFSSRGTGISGQGGAELPHSCEFAEFPNAPGNVLFFLRVEILLGKHSVTEVP